MVYHEETLENRCSFLVSFDVVSKIDAFYTGGKVQVSLFNHAQLFQRFSSAGGERGGGGGGSGCDLVYPRSLTISSLKLLSIFSRRGKNFQTNSPILKKLKKKREKYQNNVERCDIKP